MRTWLKILVAVFMVVCVGHQCFGQHDSAYVESYRGYLMARLIFNRKTTGMNYHNDALGYTLRYQPNKTFNVGAGITYKFITLKFSVGVIEPHKQKGDTRDFDIQFHSYGKKFATDILLQFYKGFYLPDNRFGTSADGYYVRPDLAVSAVGGSFQYMFNHRQFSYRAAFQQTEWQKKSAGTFLLGMELFTGRFRADSTIVPGPLRDADHENVSKMRFIEFGPNAGYIYTWVYKKFFLTAGATLSLNAGLTRNYEQDETVTYSGISPNTVLKASTGYNVKRWGVNFVYFSTGLRLPQFQRRAIVVNTGMVRMNIIYRIYPGRKVRKVLDPIDQVEDIIR